MGRTNGHIVKPDTIQFKPKWIVCQYKSDKYNRNRPHLYCLDKYILEGNLVLDIGRKALLYLLSNVGNVYLPYNKNNTYVGVGNSVENNARSYENLQGNKTKWNKVLSDYPKVTGTDGLGRVWKAEFGNGEAEFEWNELGIATSNTGSNIFARRLVLLGEKRPGMTWTAEYSLEL